MLSLALIAYDTGFAENGISTLMPKESCPFCKFNTALVETLPLYL